MKHSSIEITLGSLTFTAHPFNLGESEEVANVIAEFSAVALRQKMAAARAIVLTAIRRDQPDADDAMVRQLEAGPELMGAVTAIMRLNGYASAAVPGKAPAAAVATEAA